MNFELSIMNFEFLPTLPWDSESGCGNDSKFKIQNSEFDRAGR